MKTMKTMNTLTITALLLLLGGCAGAAPAPAPPPYVPSYSYRPGSSAGAARDITIAIINPVVKGTVRGTDGQAMLRALSTAFKDLVTAKGMKYRGPVESREAMTFPDKKGSDLGLYAEFDASAGWQPVNSVMDVDRSAWTGATTMAFKCDVDISHGGSVSFVVIEPLSGETMWRKTVQIEPATTKVPGQSGEVCNPATASAAAPSPAGEAGNQYRRALERVFSETMKGIDTYMNADEFEMLKSQAQELRAKKVY